MKNRTVHLKRVKRPRPGKPDRRVYCLRWVDDRGVQRFLTLGDCGAIAKRKAEAMRRKKQAELDLGSALGEKPDAITIDGFRAILMTSLLGVRRDTTINLYRQAMQHLAGALGGQKQVASITARDVTAVQQHLHGLGQAPATRRKTIVTLRAAFNRAIRLRYASENPFSGETLQRVQSKAKRIFSPVEIEAMVACAPTLWWKCLIRLASSTGLRSGELFNTHWQDVDFKRKIITVSAKRAGVFECAGNRYPILEWSAKCHQERACPLTDAAADQLQLLREHADASPYIFLGLPRLALLEARLVDGRLRGGAAFVNNVVRDLTSIQRRAARMLGRTDWTIGCFHDLRRSFACHAAATVPLHVLQRWLAHQSPTTTTVFYLSVTDAHADAVRDAFSDSVARASASLAKLAR